LTQNAAPTAYRHAAYFAPAPGSQAWLLGAQWLGRCPQSPKALTQPTPTGWDAAAFAQCTREPRRYGWHATLKAPFVLSSECTVTELRAGFSKVAAGAGASFILHLELARLGNFLALVPRQPSAQLQALADACVRQLHPFAAPLPPSEIDRRSRGGLSARQHDMLAQWGYPYVMQDFQFHMTLTGSLDGLSTEQTAQLLEHATTLFAPLLSDGLPIDAVSWFAEDAQGADFRWVDRFGFAP
jgi:hypothetical protein